MDKCYIRNIPVLLTTCGCLMVLYYKASFWVGIITGLIVVSWCLLLIFGSGHGNSHDWECDMEGLIVAAVTVFICALSCIIFGGIQYGFRTTRCTFKECCSDSWIDPHNITGLSSLLHEKVFGQHIAVSTIVKLLKGHLETRSTKPLVLSLHGPSGTGKSYVTQFIIENMYRQGMDSQFVHFISPMTDLPNTQDIDSYKVLLKSQIEEGVQLCPRSMFVFDMVEDMPAGVLDVLQPFLDHKREVNGVYKGKLKSQIEEDVKQCPRSMFVFDMVEYIPSGVLDVLHPFLDHNHQVNGVDYRKAMFIFISTTGSLEINGVVKNKSSGVKRRELSLNDFEQIIRRKAYESSNGLQKSILIRNNLVSAFVPFLPLEKNHVTQCIARELIARGIYKLSLNIFDTEEVELIADQLTDGQYSQSGCKGVVEKVDIYRPEKN